MVVSFAAKKTMKTTNICRPIRNLDKAMMKIVTTMMKMTLAMVTLVKVTFIMITLTLMILPMVTTSPHCPCDSPSVQACKHVDDSPCKLPSLSIVLNNCQIVNISSLSSQSVGKVYIILIFFSTCMFERPPSSTRLGRPAKAVLMMAVMCQLMVMQSWKMSRI